MEAVERATKNGISALVKTGKIKSTLLMITASVMNTLDGRNKINIGHDHCLGYEHTRQMRKKESSYLMSIHVSYLGKKRGVNCGMTALDHRIKH